jgi:N utilization substance protein B
MGERRKSREYALQVLYAMDSSKDPAEDALKFFWVAHPEELADVRGFTEELVKGVESKREEIDSAITGLSTNWKLSRMAIVDRNILRMAIYELYWCGDIPARVTLNEAIEIAKQFGTEESGSFVNGILDKVAKTLNKE